MSLLLLAYRTGECFISQTSEVSARDSREGFTRGEELNACALEPRRRFVTVRGNEKGKPKSQPPA